MKNKEYPVDIVITWVDGCDHVWLKDFYHYQNLKSIDENDASLNKRYNNNGLLKYLFRSIDKNCPWVNKVYLVTYGHYPTWINKACKKLVLVKHSDFIPKEYLPTFNSATINLNLHRIKNLSEHFIYANDDMIFLNKTKETDFFKKGKPCDCAIQDVIGGYKKDCFYHMINNDMCLLNSDFSKKTSIINNFTKWFCFKYGVRANIKNALLSSFNLFTGFFEPHTPAPYCKHYFDIIWNKHYEDMNLSCLHKFRNNDCNTENLMRWYPIAEGNFIPTARNKTGYYTYMSDPKLNKILKKTNKKMICINYDSDEQTNKNILDKLESIFPDKSTFEK